MAETTTQDKQSTVCLNAKKGQDAYSLIRSVLGKDAIEAPDDCNPKNKPHITQDTDEIVSDHFVFHMHRDLDCDPVTHNPDRQRCEIKVYEGSVEYQQKLARIALFC